MAKAMMDIALDGSDDLLVTAGDFSVTESTKMHQKQLLFNNKGEYKENPTICVGVYGYIDDENGMRSLARDTSKEYSRDGMQVDKSVILANGTLQIVAYYS